MMKVVLGSILAIALLFAYIFVVVSPINVATDLPFYNNLTRQDTYQQPVLWYLHKNNGFGTVSTIYLPHHFLHFILLWTSVVFDSFDALKYGYLIPPIILGLVSSIYFANKLSIHFASKIMLVFVFLLNPYFIMLIDGGQIGIALAYAFTPLFFYAWYQLISKISQSQRVKKENFILTMLTASIMIIFDLRIFVLNFLLVLPVVLYYYVTCKNRFRVARQYIFLAFLTILLTILTHAHWVLPAIFAGQPTLPAGHETASAVDFFSFGRFAHTLTLSHPHYPENIFGKVNEVQGISFILPILAFLALRSGRKIAIYFAAVALFAAFMAKGTNPPFSQIYSQFFQYFPTGSWFRDSSKWLTLVAFSYSVLIPLSLTNISNQIPQISSKFKFRLQPLSLALVVLPVLIFLWWPTFSHQLSGTLSYKQMPRSYSELQDTISSDQDYGRVLWIPYREPYGYSSPQKPAVDFQNFITGPDCHPDFCVDDSVEIDPQSFQVADQVQEIDNKFNRINSIEGIEVLKNLGIKHFVLVPDIENRIYTFQHKYNSQLYAAYRKNFIELAHLSNSTIIESNQLLYFQLEDTAPLLNTPYQKMNPTQYLLEPPQVEQVIFNQSYDKNWQLKFDQEIVPAQSTPYGTMSFDISSGQASQAKLVYAPQFWVDIGKFIAYVTYVAIFIAISILFLKQHGAKKI
jgi:hypothetical protein